jgi:hypothetical protein
MLRIQPFGVLGKQLTRDKKEIIRGEDPAHLDSCCIVSVTALSVVFVKKIIFLTTNSFFPNTLNVRLILQVCII